ncbi:MAG: HAD hydrolase-like protein [Bacteroidales bacterium]|nr:HAD hydrolase-like protein [Bacteroidales bacterium]
MSKLNFDAVIFDLDGVITQTALVHSRAWKKMFDEYLQEREKKFGEPFSEFRSKEDYLPYVDGKPRYEGVKSFLLSRGIEIPFGTPDDKPESETVCGLGNRKNIAFNEVLDREGVKVYESTVKLIHELKAADIRIGVASSSKNCFAVLQAAGLLPLIETRVDGEVSAEMGLKGKPEPDIFLTAAKNLNVDPSRPLLLKMLFLESPPAEKVNSDWYSALPGKKMKMNSMIMERI